MKELGSFVRNGNVGLPTEKEKEICLVCGQEIKRVRVGVGFGAGEKKICGCKSQNFVTSSRGWGSK